MVLHPKLTTLTSKFPSYVGLNVWPLCLGLLIFKLSLYPVPSSGQLIHIIHVKGFIHVSSSVQIELLTKIAVCHVTDVGSVITQSAVLTHIYNLETNNEDERLVSPK